MQNISSIRKLTLMILQILGSHKLNEHAIFDHAHSKIIEIAFGSSEFPRPCKKPFISSIHSCESLDQTGHAHF